MSLTYEKQVEIATAVEKWNIRHEHRVTWTLLSDLSSPYGAVQISDVEAWLAGGCTSQAGIEAMAIIRRFNPYHAIELAFIEADAQGKRRAIY